MRARRHGANDRLAPCPAQGFAGPRARVVADGSLCLQLRGQAGAVDFLAIAVHEPVELVDPHSRLDVEEVQLGVRRRGVWVERWNRLRHEEAPGFVRQAIWDNVAEGIVESSRALIAVELVHRRRRFDHRALGHRAFGNAPMASARARFPRRSFRRFCSFYCLGDFVRIDRIRALERLFRCVVEVAIQFSFPGSILIDTQWPADRPLNPRRRSAVAHSGPRRSIPKKFQSCFFPVGEPYFLATLAVLRFTNFIPPSRWP